ncbi:MAG: LysR family transcriptional regulator [Bacteroidales bacterium]|nr:LysR family transcriptional regulator [Bacteroidales bacterium]MCF8404427.1 LysR family transcriptional regulator [Bacteroidales bacterium]
MSKSSALDQIQFNHKIWLSSKNGKGIMGDGKWKILKAIEEHGSLKAATEALGITYRRTWGDLKEIENDLGFPLLDKSRGGKDGGQTQLTPQGKKLVEAFNAFHQKVDKVVEEAFEKFREDLNLEL